MKLEIEYVPIESISPYAGNAKLHPQEQIDQIKKSIEMLGFDDPIAVWKTAKSSKVTEDCLPRSSSA